MKQFAYVRATSTESAISSLHGPEGKFLGGGTNLVDLMKMGVEQPRTVVDVTRVPLDAVETAGDGVRIGAMARNSAVAEDPLIRSRYPVLAQALLAGASAQIRNMATVGGNLLQRTRCPYFYDPSYRECNKRVSGSGCAALTGYNRNHAILGASDHCIATHPSDMAVALAAVGATIEVRSAQGGRSIPIGDFHVLPGATPAIETVLHPGELITAVDLPPAFGGGSSYVKVRDRNSYAFALVSAAVVIDLDEKRKIRAARIALGGVAAKPWRIPAAEQALLRTEGTEAALRHAAELVVAGAKPRRHNGFKVELAKRTIVRALSEAMEHRA